MNGSISTSWPLLGGVLAVLVAATGLIAGFGRLPPAIDQTRTVGLVTLPGAFVGVMLGGGGPVRAGVTQVVVLVALLAIETGAVLMVVEFVAVGLIRPDRLDRHYRT